MIARSLCQVLWLMKVLSVRQRNNKLSLQYLLGFYRGSHLNHQPMQYDCSLESTSPSISEEERWMSKQIGSELTKMWWQQWILLAAPFTAYPTPCRKSLFSAYQSRWILESKYRKAEPDLQIFECCIYNWYNNNENALRGAQYLRWIFPSIIYSDIS